MAYGWFRFGFMEGVAMDYRLVDEFKECDFGDQRLSERLNKVADAFGRNPYLSIPAALHSRNDLEGAYRFFDNSKVSPDEILRAHAERSVERISKTSVALLVQDTTEIDLTRPSRIVVGSGPLGSGPRVGAFLHPLIAFDTQGIPLGTVWSKMWARPPKEDKLPETPSQKIERQRKTPIEQKESFRWIEGLRAARSVAIQCPQTQCVVMADSEADIYELFIEPRETGHKQALHFLIRAGQDRTLTDQPEGLLEVIRKQPCQYTSKVVVSARKPVMAALKQNKVRQKARDARMADLEVRCGVVSIARPDHLPKNYPLSLSVNVVLVEEPSPPQGQDPIRWILVTTLPINSTEEVQAVVSYYCLRWQIEIFNKTLKSGCRVEERQFETISRELNCLAVYMVVAWRVMLMARIGRECPDLSCEVLFEPSEWEAVYMISKKCDPPSTPPRLNEIIRLVAELGGFVARDKSHPGTQTLWIGIQRMHDFAHAYDSFGPGSKKLSNTCVVR